MVRHDRGSGRPPQRCWRLESSGAALGGTSGGEWETLRQLRRAQFGRKSEKLDPDQLSLAMEETEQAIAETGSTEETRTRR
jgi:hypothetical protein